MLRTHAMCRLEKALSQARGALRAELRGHIAMNRTIVQTLAHSVIQANMYQSEAQVCAWNRTLPHL